MIDADLHSNTRRVRKTWDGRKIGHTVPLETERALRLAISRKINFIDRKQAEAREKGRPKAHRAAWLNRGAGVK